MTHKVQDFPFDHLPQYSREEVALQKRVLSLYSFLEDSKDFFGHFTQPLRSLLPEGFQIDLMQVGAHKLDDLSQRFSKNGLYALVKVLPQSQYAFFSFDPLLAKLLVEAALSGGRIKESQIAAEHVRPLSALEEGVVEYLVVACLESIEKQFQKKDFSFSFEEIISDPGKMTSFFSNQDEFAAFSFQLRHGVRDFHFQLALPLSLGKSLGWDRSGQDFLRERTQDFINFKMDFQTQVGQVSLSGDEFQNLEEGDIILLDETGLKKQGNHYAGEAVMVPADATHRMGFEVELKEQDEKMIAEIQGVL